LEYRIKKLIQLDRKKFVAEVDWVYIEVEDEKQ